MDAADSDDRHIHSVAYLFQLALGQDVHIRLGVGGKGCADAEIIRAVGYGQPGLLHRVGRHAKEHIGADFGPDISCGHVLLPDVDAVRMALDGDVHVIVDDEGDAIAAAEGRKLHGFL